MLPGFESRYNSSLRYALTILARILLKIKSFSKPSLCTSYERLYLVIAIGLTISDLYTL